MGKKLICFILAAMMVLSIMLRLMGKEAEILAFYNAGIITGGAKGNSC